MANSIRDVSAGLIEAAKRRFTERITNDASGCHEWLGSRTTDGYGVLVVGGRKIRAHRFAFEVENGAIPDGLVIDHLCCNTLCVNAAHLEAVTHEENTRRAGARQTSCRRQGHDWTQPMNVRTRRNGLRYCAECDREASRSWRERKAS